MNASYILPWNHSFELDEMPRCRENETIIAIIHGYTETSDEPWISSLRRSFLRRSLPNQVPRERKRERENSILTFGYPADFHGCDPEKRAVIFL